MPTADFPPTDASHPAPLTAHRTRLAHVTLSGRLVLALGVLGLLPAAILAQDPVVVFQRDIAPILAQRCLDCHGPDQAQADFRVDDADSLLGYVEPGEPKQESMLWSDYLLADPTEADSLLMPPLSHGGPLSAGELALIGLWIEEGANWPEGSWVAPPSADGESTGRDAAAAPPEATGTWQRVWAFAGYFHPATVHFPIALLSVGALAALLSFFVGGRAEDFAFFCLLLACLSAIAATAMGWSFADERGWGTYDLSRWDRTIDRHRWGGTILTIYLVLLVPIAILGKGRRSGSLRVWWRLGLLLAAAVVGLIGHQGGELVYGSKHYDKAFERLQGPAPMLEGREEVDREEPELEVADL